MSVAGEFERRIGADELCAETARAVRENDGDALRRLGMKGFAEYAGRLSELMTGSVLDGLDYSDDFGALMRQVNSPARYAHHLVNEAGAAVQTALDERQGVRLRVVQPEYSDGRTKGLIGEALSRETPEQGTEALATGLGTGVKDAGNEFMKQNAEQRSRAGFKVTVERTGGTNCCPWCADRIGRWELKDAPKDVFGVHDNCTCMVVYTNSRGVRSQRSGMGRFIEVGYQPHVFGKGEVNGADSPSVLSAETNGLREALHFPPKEFGKHLISDAERGIINSGVPYLDEKRRLKENGISYCLRTTNPNRELSESYQLNCQRCVIAYEARRRGFDVIAKPKQSLFGIDLFALSDDRRGWSSAFEDGYDDLEIPKGNTCGEIKDFIINRMKQYGDGARAIISVAWSDDGGHAFIAEQVNGKTFFVDPQNNLLDVSDYFADNKFIPSETRMLRSDNRLFTQSIEEAVQ